MGTDVALSPTAQRGPVRALRAGLATRRARQSRDWRLAGIYLSLGLMGFCIAAAASSMGAAAFGMALAPLGIVWYAYRTHAAEKALVRVRSEDLHRVTAMVAASPDLMLRLDRRGEVLGGNAA